ncbi:hypothetical protein O7614_11340 [Micromonospora sp. WMMD961]|uniref:hypothetical protein n=1 Tax=Micromonospora sp. WMMD961 TaxID=3016100 RepID=UPI002417594F|nr:hypothetical protein [Micromonospora sp. WMMD961]MDG4780233.1 hypothetical protein [Micromonospora sp. WMMD961]
MAASARLRHHWLGRRESSLVAGLVKAARRPGRPDQHLTTLPSAGEGAVSGYGGGCDGRIVRPVYISGLLPFQQSLALRMTLRPQYVAVNNKTK